MFASLDIRPALSRLRRRRADQGRSRAYSTRQRTAGAVLALLGFASQYPIPVIHRCPVMNPNGIAVFLHDHEYHNEHAAPDHDRHGPEHAHHDTESEIEAAVAALPPCHRRIAAATRSAAHSHAGHSARTEAGDDGAGHSHDSCPVCQGHAQLLQDLPTPALPALTTLFQFQARVSDFIETPRAFFFSTQPPARAPPRFA